MGAIILLAVISVAFAVSFIVKQYIITAVLLFTLAIMFFGCAYSFINDYNKHKQKENYTIYKKAVMTAGGLGLFFVFGGVGMLLM